MTNPIALLRDSTTILLIDWAARDVPDSLARAGYRVVSNDGPDGDDYNEYVAVADNVDVRHVGRPPERVDLVYCHRPIDELPGIVAQAQALGARAVWLQSGRDSTGGRDARGTWLDPAERELARSIVEGAGLEFVDTPYIGDAAAAAA